MTRYSAWPVYITMVLAAVLAPSVLPLVYPVILFLYLILGKPRPPRTSWTSLIVYVYAAVLLVMYIGRKPEFEFVSCPDSAPEDFAVPFVSSSTIWKEQSDLQPDLGTLHWCVISSDVIFDVLVLPAVMWHQAQL